MKKSVKILISVICIILAMLGLFRLCVYVFDNTTSVKGIKQAEISVIDWDGDVYYVSNYWHATFNEKEMIKMVKEAGKEMSHHNKWNYDKWEGKFHFKVVYKCAFGIKITRMYHMNYKELKKLKCFKKLYEARKFKEKYLLFGTKRGEMYCYNRHNRKVPNELLRNMDLDLMERKYEQEHFIDESFFDENQDYISIVLNTTDFNHSINVCIYKTDKHTLKWIKDNDYENTP